MAIVMDGPNVLPPHVVRLTTLPSTPEVAPAGWALRWLKDAAASELPDIGACGSSVELRYVQQVADMAVLTSLKSDSDVRTYLEPAPLLAMHAVEVTPTTTSPSVTNKLKATVELHPQAAAVGKEIADRCSRPALPGAFVDLHHRTKLQSMANADGRLLSCVRQLSIDADADTELGEVDPVHLRRLLQQSRKRAFHGTSEFARPVQSEHCSQAFRIHPHARSV